MNKVPCTTHTTCPRKVSLGDTVIKIVMVSPKAWPLPSLCRDDPVLLILIREIQWMPIKVRKALITLTRVRCRFDNTARAYQRLSKELRIQYPTLHAGQQGESNLLMCLSAGTDPYITSPIFSGLISMACRNIPILNKEEVDELVRASLEKEMRASITRRDTPILNWSTVFNPSRKIRHSTPLVPGMMYSPDISDHVYQSLCRARSILSSMVIYPGYSKKTIGIQGSRNLARATKDMPDLYPNSTFGLEKLYHQTGIQITGPTEVRCAFKFNDIRPRIYFSRGPDQHYPSRYIQPIFNVIVDCLPTVHRRGRFDVSGIGICPGEALFIYDLITFTSNLEEIKTFTLQLADFMKGTPVTVFDTLHGMCEVDLGDMLLEYNETCNSYASFDIADILGEGPLEDACQHTCGMLGVPGNISSCTLLHGIFLICVLKHVMARVVGDDAIGKSVIEDKEDLVDTLRVIGDIAPEKMEVWESGRDYNDIDLELDSWHYTKRPIYRLNEAVVVDTRLVVWPSIGALLPQYADMFHTTFKTDAYVLKRKVANALISFVLQFKDFPASEDEITTIDRWIEWMLESSGLLSYNKVKGRKVYDKTYVYPISVREGMFEDEWIDRVWYHSYRLPDPTLVENPEKKPRKLEPFVCRGVPILKFARDMEYVWTEQRFRQIFVKDEVELFRAFLSRTLSSTYTIVVQENCPRFIYDILCSELSPMKVYPESDSGSDGEFEGLMDMY